jgi:hypothetical protein
VCPYFRVEQSSPRDVTSLVLLTRVSVCPCSSYLLVVDGVLNTLNSRVIYEVLNPMPKCTVRCQISADKNKESRYSQTDVMHFLFSLLKMKSLYMFRALLAHPQEALHKRHLVYCVCSETDVMHFLFILLKMKSLYMFRTLLAHPQEALHKWLLVYCRCLRPSAC